MQVMPNNFLVGWDTLKMLPSSIIEKLFQQGLSYQTNNAAQSITMSDMLKACGKGNITVTPQTAQSALSVLRLLCLEIVNLQISDSAALRKKLGKQFSKLRSFEEGDETLIETIGGALSEELITPIAASQTTEGGRAHIVSILDSGVETNLSTGKQLIYVTANVVDGMGGNSSDIRVSELWPTTAEAIHMIRSQ